MEFRNKNKKHSISSRKSQKVNTSVPPHHLCLYAQSFTSSFLFFHNDLSQPLKVNRNSVAELLAMTNQKQFTSGGQRQMSVWLFIWRSSDALCLTMKSRCAAPPCCKQPVVMCSSSSSSSLCSSPSFFFFLLLPPSTYQRWFNRAVWEGCVNMTTGEWDWDKLHTVTMTNIKTLPFPLSLYIWERRLL